MGVGAKIIYDCDHIIDDIEKKYGNIAMTRNIDTSIPDKVSSNIDIIRIDEILKKDKKTELSPNIDFEQKVSPNVLEWLDSDNAPNPGEEYYIKCAYNKKVVKKFDADHCERCCGNGWYIDLYGINKATYVIGVRKLCQDFIKVLFTPKQEDGYGTNISNIIGQNVYSQSELSLIISNHINDAADQILKSQFEQINNGAVVPDSEALDKVEIVSILFVKEECTCYTSLRIKNKSGESIPFTFKSI